MQKAAEELKKQQEREMEEKRKAIEARVPKLEIDGLDKRMLIIIGSGPPIRRADNLVLTLTLTPV